MHEDKDDDSDASLDPTVILSQSPILDRQRTGSENSAFFHNAQRPFPRADATVSKDGLPGNSPRPGSSRK